MFADNVSVADKTFARCNGSPKIKSHHVRKVLGIGSVERVIIYGLAIDPHKFFDKTDRGNTIRIPLAVKKRIDAP